jgi:hypothetical protein
MAGKKIYWGLALIVLWGASGCCCRWCDRMCGGQRAQPVPAAPVYAPQAYAPPVYAPPAYAQPACVPCVPCCPTGASPVAGQSWQRPPVVAPGGPYGCP